MFAASPTCGQGLPCGLQGPDQAWVLGPSLLYLYRGPNLCSWPQGHDPLLICLGLVLPRASLRPALGSPVPSFPFSLLIHCPTTQSPQSATTDLPDSAAVS